MRWIAHVDMDSFFVSVERLRDPSLIGKPVVVGGHGPRAVVASASYEARKFGVRSAMPMSQALRACKDLVIVSHHMSEYSKISKVIFAALESVAPIVEQVSIDEAYLDFTGCERLFSSREKSAEVVKDTIKRVSGLTSTVGVSTSKLVSKIASGFAKPNGLLVVPAGEEKSFLAPLPVRKLPGVGPKTNSLLESLNIRTCAELAAAPVALLRTKLGQGSLYLKDYAQGVDDRIVSPEHERKSLSSEETFDRDIGDMDYLNDLIRDMSESLARDIRSENLKIRTVQIKLRYPDFTTVTRARTLEAPTHVAGEISEVARELLRLHKDPAWQLRLLGVTVRNFVDPQSAASEQKNSESPQLNFFESVGGTAVPAQSKQEAVERLKDQLKNKFGENGITPTRSLTLRK